MQRVEIRIKGKIDQRWSEWFGDLTVTHVDDETVLSGTVVDQAELYGLLAKLRDLGLSLTSVRLIDAPDRGRATRLDDDGGT